jgi:inhibitor of cysteine peptidase
MRTTLFVLCLALVVIACDDPDYLIVTGDDTGATFEVGRNDSFEIRLQSNPSTGYSWTSVPTPGVEVGPPEFVGDVSDLVGAPGYERFEVTALQAGQIRLVFEYARSWEDVPPEQVFEVDLVVH